MHNFAGRIADHVTLGTDTVIGRLMRSSIETTGLSALFCVRPFLYNFSLRGPLSDVSAQVLCLSTLVRFSPSK